MQLIFKDLFCSFVLSMLRKTNTIEVPLQGCEECFMESCFKQVTCGT